jgi:Family of unknown function (DUF6544)
VSAAASSVTASPAWVRADLPELVRCYVERNVPADQLGRSVVHFAQVGDMQLKPGRWLPFRAEQDVAVDHVEFAWRANFRAARLVSVRVRDWYRSGVGGLDVRLWGVVPVVRASGEQFARGQAMRYLAELAWAPQAMVSNPALEWQAVDESTVEVATRIARERVAVQLHFDAAGDIVGMSTDARPRMVGKQVVDTPWSGIFGEYREFNGVRLPTTGEVSWLLSDGPFTYFRGRVTRWSIDGDAELDRVRR